MLLKSLLFSVSLFFVSFSLFSQDLITENIPAELLFKEANRRGATISPDGKYFADIIDNNVENDIVVVDIDGYVLYNKIPMGRQDVESIYWLTPKTLLYESLGSIYTIDIDGSNKKEVVDTKAEVKPKSYRGFWKSLRYNNLIGLLPGQDHLILIETRDIEFHSSVKQANIFTGKKYTMVNGGKYDIHEWILDRNLNIRMGIRYDEDKGYKYFTFDEAQKKLEPFFVTVNGSKYSLDIEAASFLEQPFTFEGFTSNPDVVFLTSNLDSDKRKLITYNLKEKKVLETLVQDTNCDIKEPHDDGLNFIYDYKTGEIGGIRYDGLTPQFKWFSQNLKNVHKKLNESYPGFVHEIGDSDYEGKRFIVYQWNDSHRGNMGIYDAEENTYDVMYYSVDDLNKYKMSKCKSVVVTTRDDQKIPCYLSLPLNYDTLENIPLVVIPHGGPWVRDYWDADPFSEFFTSRGYATLRVNFRGSTGFGKNHLLAGINNLDELMINDIVDAVRFVKNTYDIDPNGAFLYGHSYGGYATYMGLVKYESDFAGGVAVSAPSDIKAWMKDLKKGGNDFAYDFWDKALGSRDSRYLKKISPISYAETLNKPVMIFHGEYDRTIPVEQSYDMEKALKKYNKPVTFEMIQKEGHSLENSNTMGYILNTTHTFFQEILEGNK